jgi:hypothetical protein
VAANTAALSVLMFIRILNVLMAFFDWIPMIRLPTQFPSPIRAGGYYLAW